MSVEKIFMRKSVFINTFSQLIVKIITSFSTLFVTLLISYFLGINNFGSFTKIITFVSFFYLLVDFSFNQMFIKKHFDDTEKQLKNLIVLRGIISVILMMFIFIITVFLPYNPLQQIGFSSTEKWGVFIFSFTLLTQGFIMSCNAVLQKQKNYVASIYPYFLSSFVLLAIVGIGIFYKNILIIVSAFFFSGLTTYILLFYEITSSDVSFNLKTLYKRSKNTSSFKGFSFSQLATFKVFSKNLLLISYPIALMLFLNVIYAKVDIIILSFSKSSLDVGIYGFSYRIFEFIIAVPAFFSNSVYTTLLEKEQDTKSFVKHIKSYSRILIVISIFFMAITLIGAPLLTYIKKDFSFSVMPLQILSLSLPFFFLTSLLQWVLIIKGKKLFLILLYLLSLIINITLNVIFIPQYSYIAASIITVISEGIVFAGMILYIGIYKGRIYKNGTITNG